jgi:hypothetical protein
MSKQSVQALGVMLNAVKAKKDTLDQHPAKAVVDRSVFGGDGAKAFLKSLDDAVYVRKGDLFFTGKVQVDTALADADLVGEIVDRHLLIPVPGKQAIGSVENGVAGCFWLNCVFHK